MPKLQYSSRTAALGYLSKPQALLILASDENTGIAGGIGNDDAPEWLIQECHDLGLITPGNHPNIWKLTQDGLDARAALLSD